MLNTPSRLLGRSLLAYLHAKAELKLIVLVYSLSEAVVAAEISPAWVVILDADLAPFPEFLEKLQELKVTRPQDRRIVLVNGPEQAAACQKAGAQRTLLKGLLDEDLLEAVLAVERGECQAEARPNQGQPAGCLQ